MLTGFCAYHECSILDFAYQHFSGATRLRYPPSLCELSFHHIDASQFTSFAGGRQHWEKKKSKNNFQSKTPSNNELTSVHKGSEKSLSTVLIFYFKSRRFSCLSLSPSFIFLYLFSHCIYTRTRSFSHSCRQF